MGVRPMRTTGIGRRFTVRSDFRRRTATRFRVNNCIPGLRTAAMETLGSWAAFSACLTSVRRS